MLNRERCWSRTCSAAGSRSGIYHYLHERHRVLVPHVEAVLRAMKNSGELEQLRARLVAQVLEKAGEPRG